MRVLDAGCGTGRNLVYLMQAGYDLAAVDADPAAIGAVRALAARLAPHLPRDNFRTEPLEAISFPAESFDAVVSSAVLHFARDDAHFEAMLRGSWRPLARSGIFFCRLASSIGIEDEAVSIEGRRCALPDGSTRYLVDEAMLLSLTESLGGELLDPIKTTVVQNQRAMTTWVVRKLPGPADRA
jgi:SAM-dependent methyltransferase